MNTMTNNDNTTPATMAAFPPIPVLSGDAFVAPDGHPHALASVTITLTSDDGTTVEIACENKFGGWWAPANALSS